MCATFFSATSLVVVVLFLAPAHTSRLEQGSKQKCELGAFQEHVVGNPSSEPSDQADAVVGNRSIEDDELQWLAAELQSFSEVPARDGIDHAAAPMAGLGFDASLMVEFYAPAIRNFVAFASTRTSYWINVYLSFVRVNNFGQEYYRSGNDPIHAFAKWSGWVTHVTMDESTVTISLPQPEVEERGERALSGIFRLGDGRRGSFDFRKASFQLIGKITDRSNSEMGSISELALSCDGHVHEFPDRVNYHTWNTGGERKYGIPVRPPFPTNLLRH